MATTDPTPVAASATQVTLLTANPSRTGYVITNETGGATLYITEGSVVTVNAYTHAVLAGSEVVDSEPGCWTGPVVGLWASASGRAMVQEH